GNDEASGIESGVDEGGLLGAQADDVVSDLDHLMVGLSQAVSWNPADTAANDALLRRAKGELASFVADIFVFDRDGNNIGFSADPEFPRPSAAGQPFFERVVAGRRLAFGDA